ncbi:MAG: 5-formyltetrahydrofolate cyclo-ligase [Flavobacteriaceae bacterium]|nr:5-formyltetrahydrofolate cyclo-ligase [Flavobacteriaceae bacterium]
MNKADFRRKYKELRATLTEEEVDDMSMAIANQSLALPIWDQTYYHLFLTISEKKEVNTEFLLHILLGRDKSVVVSKSDFNTHKMQHILLQENTELKISSYGIPEPISGIDISEKTLDVVFVPLLAFDKKGHRIGYGKGFYDRFLKSCKKEAIFVGLSFFEAEDKLPNEETDVRLDYCISPSKLYEFT